MSNNSDHIGDIKISFFTSFIRSQMTAFLATAMDFIVYITCVDYLGVYYVVAAGISAFIGAVISFFLGRNWAFQRKDGSLTRQAIKYIFTSGTSLILNISGIYILTEYGEIPDIYSKVIISILVGVFFNFLMYRYFVYK